MSGRPLRESSIEAWSLHIQYFTVLTILNRSPEGKSTPSTASLLASSFVSGLFADLMARDQLQYLGPIFTFYCLTAGMAQLSCYRYSGIIQTAEDNLLVLKRALQELGGRWPTAVGSLKHLLDVREKVVQRPSLGQFPDINMPATTAQILLQLWSSAVSDVAFCTSTAPADHGPRGVRNRGHTPWAAHTSHPTRRHQCCNAATDTEYSNPRRDTGTHYAAAAGVVWPPRWHGKLGGDVASMIRVLLSKERTDLVCYTRPHSHVQKSQTVPRFMPSLARSALGFSKGSSA